MRLQRQGKNLPGLCKIPYEKPVDPSTRNCHASGPAPPAIADLRRLSLRMLILGYVFAIRSERALCREVQVNLAYRWFCGLSIEDKVPNHSAFSSTCNERFRDSVIFRRVFVLKSAFRIRRSAPAAYNASPYRRNCCKR